MAPVILTISGPAGGGKSLLEEGLIKECGRAGKVITFTTRLPREDEEHGRHYYFTTQTGLDKLGSEGKLLWRVKPHSQEHTEYAASAVEFRRAYSSASGVGFVAITPDKHLAVRNRFEPEGIKVVMVHLCSPGDDELRRRLQRSRRMSAQMIEARIADSRRMDLDAMTVCGLNFIAPGTPEETLGRCLELIQAVRRS